MNWVDSKAVHDASSCVFKLPGCTVASKMSVLPLGAGNFGWKVMLYIPGSVCAYKASGNGCIDATKARHMAMSMVSAFLQIHDGVKPDEVA